MNEWKLISHSYQIADTGDYDGHYEITNGEITLYIIDDDSEEALQKVVDALNNSGCKFEVDNSAKWELELLKRENKRLWNLLVLSGIDPTGNNFYDF